jgi:ATP-binding cassette subfamily C protein CydC
VAKATFSELIRLGLPKQKGFKLGLFVSVLQGISAVALMATSAWLISRAAEQPPIMYLNIAVVLVRGFALGRAFFRYTERLLLHNAAFAMLTELRPRLFAKLIPLSPAGLGSSNRADTVTKLVNDVDEIQNLPLRVIAPLLQSAAVSLLTVGVLAWLNPGAGLSLLVALLLAVLVALPVSARASAVSNAKAAEMRSELNVASATFVENLEVLQAYGWVDTQLERVAAAQQATLKLARDQAITAGLGAGMFSALAAMATAASAYFGGVYVASQQTPGVMLAVFALVPLAVFDILQNVQPAIGAWQRYSASANRVHELLTDEVPSELAVQAGTNKLDQVRSIEVRELTAKYPGSAEVAGRPVSFTLEAGQSLLLQGPSGSGKSTTALVLSGLLNPAEGSFLINDIKANSYSAGSISARVGYLEQSPMMFMGSLRANLLIAAPAATDEELWTVIERVKLAETFRAREGLETELGERGVAISGGEAQRIALARALLANFDVVIFDEPTANVDPATAEKLWADLLGALKADSAKMGIFISHEPLEAFTFDKRVSI